MGWGVVNRGSGKLGGSGGGGGGGLLWGWCSVWFVWVGVVGEGCVWRGVVVVIGDKLFFRI